VSGHFWELRASKSIVQPAKSAKGEMFYNYNNNKINKEIDYYNQ
jgi:hypothetical protein